MGNYPTTYIYCDQSDLTVPLLLFHDQGKQSWTCFQPLPNLIGKPVQLADKLPRLEPLRPSKGYS
jgi:hypothetical protein